MTDSTEFRRGLAMAVKIARETRDAFLDPTYATDQPISSFAERFACDQVASNIEDRFGLGTLEQQILLAPEPK